MCLIPDPTTHRTRTTFGLAVLLFATLASTSWAATFTVEARSNATFSPANLQISVGDSVTWVNAGGLHNVAASDASFRCANGCDGSGGNGDPASNDWSFTLTFDQVETIDYFCEVHEALGMTGTIQVSGAQSQPGTLRFSSSSSPIAEGAGTTSLHVQRVGGSDGAVGVSFASSDGSAQSGMDYTASSGLLSWPDGDANDRIVGVPILDDANTEGNETFTVALSAPTGGASLGSPANTTVTIQDNDGAPSPGTLRFADGALSVTEDAATATVSVLRVGGSDGPVTVDFATSDGSASAGTDYESTQETLSWADGDTADKSVDVPVLDDFADEDNETVNLQLSNPTGGADLGPFSAATLTIVDDDQEPVGPCVADAETLCLNRDDRFQVRVDWRDFSDNTGRGQTVEIDRRDSGLFYFFNQDNIEMLIKVLDACNAPGFNSFWVFYAATTNVEFTITVTDTETGAMKQYFNALGETAVPITDTAAFDTCP